MQHQTFTSVADLVIEQEQALILTFSYFCSSTIYPHFLKRACLFTLKLGVYFNFVYHSKLSSSVLSSTKKYEVAINASLILIG